jgi:hypothetical protein
MQTYLDSDQEDSVTVKKRVEKVLNQIKGLNKDYQFKSDRGRENLEYY